MPRIARPLTHTEVSKARTPDKALSLHDGDGLFLLIKPSGKKLWRFRYLRPDTKKRTTLSFGSYLALSLADARQLRAEHLALLAKGIDPQEKVAKEEEAQIAVESIFINVARCWFMLKQTNVSADHAKDIWRSLEKDVLPAIENIPVQEIKARPLIQALKPVAHLKPSGDWCSALMKSWFMRSIRG